MLLIIIKNSCESICNKYPEWKSDIRVIVICTLLSNPLLCEQSYSMINEWIEDHMKKECVFSYDGLQKIQNSLLQICTDYYSKENYSLCAIVMSYIFFFIIVV